MSLINSFQLVRFNLDKRIGKLTYPFPLCIISFNLNSVILLLIAL